MSIKYKKRKIKKGIYIGITLFLLISGITGKSLINSNDKYTINEANDNIITTAAAILTDSVNTTSIIKNVPYYTVNNNIPSFTTNELTMGEFEYYSELDQLGRCGPAMANICINTMPTEERGEIGQIKPSGWHTIKYPEIIEGNYLYNRCHLIAFCLSGENANNKNLITGTRYMNTEGMLPFEIKVAKYVEKTHNHVLYRSTPLFEGNNLIASGVQIEAYSIEDSGKGICFNVICPNIQPGIKIDYLTGNSQEI